MLAAFDASEPRTAGPEPDNISPATMTPSGAPAASKPALVAAIDGIAARSYAVIAAGWFLKLETIFLEANSAELVGSPSGISTPLWSNKLFLIAVPPAFFKAFLAKL